MAAIGGSFNIDGARVKTDILFDMSRAMLARGGSDRTAYINGAGGIFSGAGADDMGGGRNILGTVRRGEKNITLALDGVIRAENGETFFGSDGTSFALECYLKYGTAMGEYLSGEFAIAVYDEERQETVLLRDGLGSRPLYYIRDGNTVFYSSEIKGVARAVSGAVSVDMGRLREHLLSPCGCFGGSELYREIFQIAHGGGCVFSRLGASPFVYPCKKEAARGRIQYGTVREGFVCPDEEGMRRLLCEILFAFDYPQFDILMPTFIRDLLYIKDRGMSSAAAVADGSLYMDIGYSAERRDRLCSLAGVRAMCVPPEKGPFRERDAKRMDRVLRSLLAEEDKEALRHIFGSGWEGDISREKNTARRARMEGMMLQSVFWFKSYQLREA